MEATPVTAGILNQRGDDIMPMKLLLEQALLAGKYEKEEEARTQKRRYGWRERSKSDKQKQKEEKPKNETP